jgi:hypothetical protein
MFPPFIMKCVANVCRSTCNDCSFGKPLRRFTQSIAGQLKAIYEDRCDQLLAEQAIREVRSRRLSNLDYLKSRDLENVETGERFSNVPRDDQTVRVARRVANELNAYDEEVKKVMGIFAPHLGESHVYETRTTQWRIVTSAVDSEVLTAKSASGAPRSPVNNCGLLKKHKPEARFLREDFSVNVSVILANEEDIERNKKSCRYN